ncbi:hypothetical protein RJ639_003603 [Escallonia herrerae]|uniref:Uncharacterized protein n=1 Tax=Escallonia herrerae TaxID=1293975 RepID=A0AA88W964_9ASTE|nr:hypothetical protein RJ639_003603 [Escallonia herrerae]
MAPNLVRRSHFRVPSDYNDPKFRPVTLAFSGALTSSRIQLNTYKADIPKSNHAKRTHVLHDNDMGQAATQKPPEVISGNLTAGTLQFFCLGAKVDFEWP